MGNSPPEPVTAEANAVSVTKSVDTDRFPVDAISYSIESEESMKIRLTDTIPDSLPLDAVGFHPDFGEEHWETSPDGTLEYTRELSAGDSVETVFGIRESEVDFEQLLSEPDVVTQPVSNGTHKEGETVDDVRDSSDDTPAPETSAGQTATTTTQAAGESASIPEPSADSRPPTDTSGPDKTSIDTAAQLLEQLENGEIEIDNKDALGSGLSTKADADTPIIEQLITELNTGDIDESVKDDLRNELNDADSRSVEVRIKRLQSTVADLDAYTEALQAFLDENGTAQELLGSLDERLETATTDITALEEQVETVEMTAEQTATELDDTTDRVDELEQRLGSDLDDVGEEIDQLHADISELQEFKQQVESAFAQPSVDD